MTRTCLLLALAACDNLQGTGGPLPPLATYTVEVGGNHPRPPHHLAIALVWGMQWLPEPFCILPPDPAHIDINTKSVQSLGCRDPFGFVPARVEANVDLIDFPGTAQINLYSLPAADVLVGDLTARVGYGSMVLYDDLNDSGTLELARPNRLGVPTEGPGSEPGSTMLPDTVLGASFVSMTTHDERVAYREGAFNAAAAFYPRGGCGDPPKSFSVLAASGFDGNGFTYMDALIASLTGLPQEFDVSQCVQAAPSDATIHITLPVPSDTTDPYFGPVLETACTERNADSSVRYREPPTTMPDLTSRNTTCVHVPTFDPNAPLQQIELIVTGRSDDPCKGLTHYILKGCRQDPNCAVPDWDHSLAPPTWWPCPLQ